MFFTQTRESAAKIFSIVILCQLRSEISLHSCHNLIPPTQIVQTICDFRVIHRSLEGSQFQEKIKTRTGVIVEKKTFAQKKVKNLIS